MSNNNYMTPVWLLEIARNVLGCVDLDPCTEKTANDTGLQVKKYFTIEDDGLHQPWGGNVFCNPPGGMHGSESSQLVWLRKCIKEHENNGCDVFFLSFNLSLFQQIGMRNVDCGGFLGSFLSRRVNFERAESGVRASDNSPMHPNGCILISEDPIKMNRFSEEMSKFRLGSKTGTTFFFS